MAVQARLALSSAADRATTLGSNEQAAAYLRSAVALTQDPASRTELLLRAAMAASRAARHADAVAVARGALVDAEAAGDATLAGRAGSVLGEVLIDQGDPPGAVAALEAADAAYPADAPPAPRAEILGSLSRAYMRVNDPRRAVAAADRALEIAEALGLDRVIAETLNNKGSSLGYLGRNREGVALLEGAVSIARAGGHVAAEIRALSNLGSSSDDNMKSIEALAAAAELGRRVGNRSMARWSEDQVRWFSYFAGAGWDEAIAGGLAQLDDDRANGLASDFDEARTLLFTSYLLIARGDPAEHHVDRLAGLAGTISDPVFAEAGVLSLRVERSLVAGNLGGAARDGLAAAELDTPARGYFAAIGVRPAIWSRDRDAVGRMLALLESLPPSPTGVGTIMSVRAAIAAIDGRTEEAAAGYRDGISRIRAVSSDFEASRMSLDCALLVGPEHPVSRMLAADAREVFERCRATPYLQRLDAAMAGVAATAVSPG